MLGYFYEFDYPRFLRRYDQFPKITVLIEKDYPLSIKLKNKWGYQSSLIHGTHEILFVSPVNEQTLAIFREDYTTGDISATYEMEADVDYVDIGTNIFFDDQLLYVRSIKESNDFERVELVVFNTKKNQKNIILSYRGSPQEVTRIRKPAFSPNGKWIAYTSESDDGIYLIRPDGTENHRLVKIENHSSLWVTTVSWSPDGKSFVYHQCVGKNHFDCENANKPENNVVYRYDIETGDETVLVVGGINPYWRWVNTK